MKFFQSSFGEGILDPKRIVSLAEENKEDRVILADRGTFSGLVAFYMAAKAKGIKPILGVGLRFEDEGVDAIVLFKNKKGMTRVQEMVSTDSLSLSTLKEDEVILIALGMDDMGRIEEVLPRWAFVGAYGWKDLPRYAKAAALYRARNGRRVAPIQWVEAEAENYRALFMARAIREKASFISKNDFDQVVLMEEESPNLDESAIEAELDTVVDDFHFGEQATPPAFLFRKEVGEALGLPHSSDAELFEALAKKGLEERLARVPEERHDEYRRRLQHEIDIINSMKFPGYMLTVWDFVRAAKDKGIPVGPGRGSAAGSLVAYALRITNIDPMPYGLLFERFLNPERVSMPDIDMDFCQDRRPEVLEDVRARYGDEHVAQIITFGRFVAKGSIRDVARTFGFPLKDADRLAKLVPDHPGATLEEAEEVSEKALNEIFEEKPQARRVWQYAKNLTGLVRNTGVHAAGVIISDRPVWENAPTTKVGDVTVTQYDGKYVEAADLVKFDFLGLKTLSMIDQARKMAERNHRVKIVMDDLDLNDPEVYKMISSGDTDGVFQIESSGMKALCASMKPDSFEDLVALIALYRPGPMESGMLDDFVKRKHGEAEITYMFPELEPILKPTYGVIVYQEQVMQIVQTIAGFSLGEADLVRRAMGKKIKEEMDKLKEKFSEGAAKNGFDPVKAAELFELIVKFAGYGFNKSHSAAYAMIGFQTAWLKRYYPAEFYAALMNYESDVEKVGAYAQSAEASGVTVLKPDVNTSSEKFDALPDGRISFSLSTIKGVGSGAKPLIEEREEKGPFSSLEDFKERLPKLNKRVFTALVHAGALDALGNRGEMLGEEREPTLAEKLNQEFNVCGRYITDPFDAVKGYIAPYRIPRLSQLAEGRKHYVLVFPQSFDSKISKAKKRYGILRVFYGGETAEVLAFGDDKVEELSKMDLARPVILQVSAKEGGSFFLNKVMNFTRSNLALAFRKK